MPMLFNRAFARFHELNRDRRGFVALTIFTMFSIFSMLILTLYSTTADLGTFQRITGDQLALLITHDAANLVANYDTTSNAALLKIPPSVVQQIDVTMAQELQTAGGSGSVACVLPSVSSVRCTISYHSPNSYLALGGEMSRLIGTLHVTRTASLVTFGAN